MADNNEKPIAEPIAEQIAEPIAKSSPESEIIDYTSSEDMAAIKPFDSTVEIVGFVDTIESTRAVGKGYTIFKFILNNGRGDKVQIITSNKEIQRIEPVIRTNYIVHLDGAYCKPNEGSKWNKGTVPYELIIQSNTIVNVLGKQNIESEKDADEPELVEVGKVAQFSNQRIKVHGFIKSNFGLIEKQPGKGNEFNCGSITDGHWKLEIHIPIVGSTTDDEDDAVCELEKGEHIQAIGTVQTSANPIYFLVQSLKDITKIDSTKMTLRQLLRGTKPIEKIRETPKEGSVKKQKLNN